MEELIMNKLHVLYEDNHLIVVVKPVNILSQKDSTNDNDMLSIIKDYLKEKYHKPGNVYLGLVHRLDRVVGGVMVFAKTSKAASRLSACIQNHTFHKGYLAIVHGKVKDEDTLIDYMKKKDDFSTIITNKENGQYAELSYNLLDYNKERDLSLVKISLKTGRHHQIRVQFSSRKYPLIGDNRYGIDNEKRIGLFAYQLSFIHPVKKEAMHFTYYPEDYPFNIFNIKKYHD